MSAAPQAHQPTDDPVTTLRLALRRNGYRPVPVAGMNGRWITKPGKAALLPNWRACCLDADEAEIRRWWTTFNYDDNKTYRGDLNTNTGLLCGVDTVGADIDVLDEALAREIEDLAYEMLGPTPLKRIGRAPKLLLAYRSEKPFGKIQTPELWIGEHKSKVEILAAGQQFVAFGTHPETKADYVWTDKSPLDVPAADLPTVTADRFAAFVNAAEAILRRAGGKTDAERAKPNGAEAKGELKRSGTFFDRVNDAALADIAKWAPSIFPKERFPSARLDRTGAYRVSSADLGRPELQEEMSIHPKGIRHWGEEKGTTPINVAMTYGGKPTPKEAAFAICGWLGVEPREFGWKAPDSQQRDLRPSHWSELLDLPRRPYLIKGMLHCGAMSVVFGAPGSMKTFVTLDLALHVAMGRAWCGQKVRSGSVVYIACEGGRSIEDRLAAFVKHHDVNRVEVPFYVLAETVNLREPAADVERLIAAIKAIPGVTLIVVDTLSRALAGGNENGPEDMGAFVMCADRLRTETDAHVLIIHHTGKDETRGARGHSSLKAATDTEIVVERFEDLCTLHTIKQRDLPQDFAVSFEWRSIQVGDDEDGDPVTSLVMISTTRQPDPNANCSKQAKLALDVLWTAIKTEGVVEPDAGVPPYLRVITEERWRELCAARPLSQGKGEATRKAFQRAKEALEKEKLIGTSNGLVWPWPKERTQDEMPF